VEDPDLIGYLLQTLDPETEQQVDTYLREHPEGQERLTRLRQWLAPLAADADDPEPPADLVVRTIARVAEYRCRPLPRAPEELPARRLAFSRSWWRRADLAVAASILLCAAFLTVPALNMLRARHDRLACENNLRRIGQGLLQYADRTTNNRFPDVTRAFSELPEDQLPVANGNEPVAAGLFLPMLVQAGTLSQDQVVSLNCPGLGQVPDGGFFDLGKLRQMSPEEFQQHAANLVPSYAYTLGYLSNGQVHGLSRDDGVLPIVSDNPPSSPDNAVLSLNSLNHGNRGQNVLFTDGHVEWCVNRVWNQDDFFINQANRLQAGLSVRDYVLGPSAAQP